MYPKPDHHDLPESVVLKKVLKTELGVAYMYDDVIVFEGNEGVTLSYETAFSILVKGLTYVDKPTWVYISNRIHSYSLNPQDYIYLEKIPELKGIAVVSNNKIGQKNAEMESAFFKKPFQSFSSLSKAFLWAKELLSKGE